MSRGYYSKFRDWPGHAWLALPARFYLGVVFLLACCHKILHPDQFALDVATYQFLPLALINGFAIALPWVELGAGVLLLSGWKSRSAALLVALMMVAFMVALMFALNRGLDMSCGCFASKAVAEGDPISGMTLIRDGFWLFLAMYVLLFDRRPIGLASLWGRRVTGGPPESKIMEV